MLLNRLYKAILLICAFSPISLLTASESTSKRRTKIVRRRNSTPLNTAGFALSDTDIQSRCLREIPEPEQPINALYASYDFDRMSRSPSPEVRSPEPGEPGYDDFDIENHPRVLQLKDELRDMAARLTQHNATIKKVGQQLKTLNMKFAEKVLERKKSNAERKIKLETIVAERLMREADRAKSPLRKKKSERNQDASRAVAKRFQPSSHRYRSQK